MVYGLAVAVGFGTVVLWVLAMVAGGIESARTTCWGCGVHNPSGITCRECAKKAAHQIPAKTTWVERLSVAFFAVGFIVIVANVFGLMP